MSAHAILPPSSAYRWLVCTPSARFEQQFPDKTNVYAEEGTLAHKMCELEAKKKFTPMSKRTYNAELKKLKADPLWDDEMLKTAETYVDHLYERYMEYEHAPHIAFETRVDLAAYVPESFGTCDALMIGGDTLTITDYKHGKGVAVDVEENPQMMLYALGVLELYRPIYKDSIKRIRMYIDQPRLNSYGMYLTTTEELLKWAKDIVIPKAQTAFAGAGEYVPGKHCKFCRAGALCGHRAGSMTALEDFKDFALPNQTDGADVLTDAQVGDLLQRGELLIEWVESLKKYALDACLAGKEIPGWKAVEGKSIRKWSDQDKALDAIIAAGTPREVVFDTVPKSLSNLEKLLGKKEFEKVAGALVVRPPGKPMLAAASDKRPAYSSVQSDFKDVVNQ